MCLNLYKKQVRLEIRDVRARFSLAAGGWVYLNPHMSPEKPTYDAPFWYHRSIHYHYKQIISHVAVESTKLAWLETDLRGLHLTYVALLCQTWRSSGGYIGPLNLCVATVSSPRAR